MKQRLGVYESRIWEPELILHQGFGITWCHLISRNVILALSQNCPSRFGPRVAPESVLYIGRNAICSRRSTSGGGVLGLKELAVNGLGMRNHLECRG